MKKICLTLILSLAVLCMHSALVIADNGYYTAGVNSYTDDSVHRARTVLIYKGTQEDAVTPESIYYVNQTYSEYGFSGLEMMMKRDDLTDGYYTLVTDKEGKIATFEISKTQAKVAGYEVMKCLGARKSNKDNTYSVAFGISTKSILSDTAKLSMIFGDNLYTTDLFGNNSIIEWKFGPLSYKDNQGADRTMFAIQIDGVSEENVSIDENGNVTPDFGLYLEN